jgi:broad specificity phosphatase PhoE
VSTRLLLIRHGESAWNVERRVQGQADVPLSAHGTRQVHALAEALSARPLVAVYSSPLSRAHATAAHIAARHLLRPCVMVAVQEVNLGAWQGHIPGNMSADMRDRYLAWLRDPASISPPGGETLAEAVIRVVPAIETIRARHAEATVALVTHSIIGRVLLCHLLGIGLELVPRLKLKTASIATLRLDGNGAVLEQLGDTAHLRALRAAAAGELAGTGGRTAS